MFTWPSSYPTGHCFSASILGSSSSAYYFIDLPSLGISCSAMMYHLWADVTHLCISGPDVSSELILYKTAYLPSPPRCCPGISNFKFTSQTQTIDLSPQSDPSSGFTTTLVKGSFASSNWRQKARCYCWCLSTHPHPILHPLLLYLPKPPPSESPLLCTWIAATAF